MESTAPGVPGIPKGAAVLQPTSWWVMALLGVLSIVTGVLALAYPDITLLVLGLVLGVNLLLAGCLGVMVAVGDESAGGGIRALQMIVGFLAVLAGLVCLVRPGASVLALLLAVSFWFVTIGIADLARAFVEPQGRVLSALLGVVGIAVGVVLVADPDIGLETLALLAGIGFIVRGVVEVAVALSLRRVERPA